MSYDPRPPMSAGFPDSDRVQRERSRSPRRRSSRSPRRSRRSYSPRSRSRSRDDYRRSDRRSRSPLSASGAAGPSGSPYGGRSSYAPGRTSEDRFAAKENMMQSVRDSSQQDRRVYVGNLSYDVKWHHLKDFMRQAGEVLFADVLLLPNGMSKVGANA
ncbi:RNA-binding protein [Penicillium macrosclerotiorum]|uniref:RNA-binding protein n=1 Tax=Penicillium macrosclerotiorum TaxID=303699 RepID=UPI002549B40E|nr:RNA-binding protein [Penicillium macrosclerotiorum]KAJ5679683.1 RNA-binding protein [Penicillium macrosclerotiorum]